MRERERRRRRRRKEKKYDDGKDERGDVSLSSFAMCNVRIKNKSGSEFIPAGNNSDLPLLMNSRFLLNLVVL